MEQAEREEGFKDLGLSLSPDLDSSITGDNLLISYFSSDAASASLQKKLRERYTYIKQSTHKGHSWNKSLFHSPPTLFIYLCISVVLSLSRAVCVYP